MKKLLFIIISIILLTSGCSAKKQEIRAEETYVPVEVMQPIEGNISKELTFAGEVSSEESVIVSPMLMNAEKALNILVKVGDYVERDQVLATLDDDNTSDQVESSRLQYELAKSSYNSQYESYLNVVENFEKIKVLYESGAVSKSEYDSAKLRASDNQLKLLKDQLNQAEFGYKKTLENLDELSLIAPVSGIVSDINISEKNLVSSQNTITVLNMDNLEVKFYIPEGKIDMVKPGMEVNLEIPSIGITVESTVDWVNPQKDQRKNMYVGSLKLSNVDKVIYPGMRAFVNVELTNKKIVLLPIDSVLFDEENYVYIVNQNKPERVIVNVGDDNGEMIEIVSGLSENDFVVVKGQNFIKEDSTIKVVRGQ
ncbi:MAG: efflux RND transporter periplasmic adaptor subunit [Clostridiales bacterium]|nr:efflux RND transporter periplasmic adaptor subunit [Clostridiales bacterium]